MEWNKTVWTRYDQFDTKEFAKLSLEVWAEWIAPMLLLDLGLMTLQQQWLNPVFVALHLPNLFVLENIFIIDENIFIINQAIVNVM